MPNSNNIDDGLRTRTFNSIKETRAKITIAITATTFVAVQTTASTTTNTTETTTTTLLATTARTSTTTTKHGTFLKLAINLML